ncbi:MAG: MotA/TolQ/ExbB proton channel family protein, partial [Pontibacterium sp.]
LIAERLSFRLFAYRKHRTRTFRHLSGESNLYKRQSELCNLDMALAQQFSLIKCLIALCPLVGLLGTVSGMIQVFESVSVHGTSNLKLMAAGIASATLPTMTGMAVAVVGLLFYSRLHKWAQAERQHLKQWLVAQIGKPIEGATAA